MPDEIFCGSELDQFSALGEIWAGLPEGGAGAPAERARRHAKGEARGAAAVKNSATNAPPVIRAADYLTGEVFSVERTTAGWWATKPVPDDIGRYYPKIYYGERRRRFPGPVEWLQSWLYGRRAGWVTRVAGRAGTVLDVGCGPGHLLARFRALGWATVGTEATPAATAIPREKYGLDVRAGELGGLKFSGASFDAVVSWHTLEHMRDPLDVLDEFTRLLKPGGLLFVSVPDFSSPEAIVKPSAWFHLDVPRHLAHFPADILRSQLRARGFSIAAEGFFAPEYDTFSLTQTWQNRLGLPHNLLYLMLKSSTGAGTTQPTFAERIAAGLLAVVTIPFAAIVTLWRTWRQRGAVIVILARKAGSVQG
ncbi:MAG: class I SAM-dependent methyltransferase [Opitutus sp.]|nr:class I SAM-dependent methyltransferase [Opitutus sp.]